MRKYEKELKQLRELYQQGVFAPEFYSRKVDSIECFRDYDSFLEIPLTYKRDLRNTPAMERTTTQKKDIYGVFSSSGTTGQKTFYIYNKNDKLVHEEFVKAFYTELGICPEDIGAVMAPVDTGVMAHTMMWQFTTMGAGYINCSVPSPENMIDTVTKVPVTVLATRPSIASNIVYNPLIRQLARQSTVKKLVLGGGFLSKERRKLLEDAWDADCYNMFGMSEVFGPMAGECRQKDGLHYLDRYLMIELLDPDSGKPVDGEKPGVAVYTTLWDKGFPLLRYWTDDLMIIRTEKCKCGSDLPRLYYLGRLNDCFKICGGYVFPENVENILFSFGHIGEYLVEKEKDGYLVKFECNNTSIDPQLPMELRRLFKAEVRLVAMTPGSLNYDGHAKRFVTEE